MTSLRGVEMGLRVREGSGSLYEKETKERECNEGHLGHKMRTTRVFE